VVQRREFTLAQQKAVPAAGVTVASDDVALRVDPVRGGARGAWVVDRGKLACAQQEPVRHTSSDVGADDISAVADSSCQGPAGTGVIDRGEALADSKAAHAPNPGD